MQIEIMTYNIQYGVGQDWQYDLNRTLDVIKDKDIVCLQEVTTNWPICNNDNQPEMLATGTNRFMVFAPGFETDVSTTAKDGTITNARRGFGNMILSRWPILYSRVHSMPRPAVDIPPEFFPSVDFPRVALEAVIDVAGTPLRVVSLHLSHLPGAQRDGQIDVLKSMAAGLPDEATLWGDDPRILAWSGGQAAPVTPKTTVFLGDFNFDDEDPALQDMMAPIAGQKHGLIDGWADALSRTSDGMTCAHSDGKTTRLDFMFMTPDMAGRVNSANVDHSNKSSDHYPLSFRLDL